MGKHSSGDSDRPRQEGPWAPSADQSDWPEPKRPESGRLWTGPATATPPADDNEWGQPYQQPVPPQAAARVPSQAEVPNAPRPRPTAGLAPPTFTSAPPRPGPDGEPSDVATDGSIHHNPPTTPEVRRPDHTNPPPTPEWFHRLPPICLTVAITGSIILGTQTERWFYALGIGVLQTAAVVCLTWVRSVPHPWIVWASSMLSIVAGNALVVQWPRPSITPLLVFLAFAVQAALLMQVLNPRRRDTTNVTGTASLAIVAVFGYGCYLVLSRLGAAPPAMYSALLAAGCAIVTARAVDLSLPDPRINRQIPRGAFGVVLGTMAGTAAAAYAGMVIEGPEPATAAIGGLIIALTAILSDIAVAYLVASRRIDGDGGAPWPVTGIAGPLFAFGMTGPVVYLLSAYYIIA
ncbi:hypothetical protein [Haloglycomyces albus]|uniref:hypothetical protein n=1 Tax=Haloglycomyces albus TaxID=526067 RepID=UPI00046D6C4D|nr:hypothetical protein [Haloglycomyces albus]